MYNVAEKEISPSYLLQGRTTHGRLKSIKNDGGARPGAFT